MCHVKDCWKQKVTLGDCNFMCNQMCPFHLWGGGRQRLLVGLHRGRAQTVFPSQSKHYTPHPVVFGWQLAPWHILFWQMYTWKDVYIVFACNKGERVAWCIARNWEGVVSMVGPKKQTGWSDLCKLKHLLWHTSTTSKCSNWFLIYVLPSPKTIDVMLPFVNLWLNITLTFRIHRQLCYTWTIHIHANMKNIGKRVSFVNVLNAWFHKHVCIMYLHKHVFVMYKTY